MSETKKCLIVDGNNLIYSSYHVAQKITWKLEKGTIFFFFRVLISILKKKDYQKLLITFDGGGTNWRETFLPQYKAQRVSMPEELWKQMEEIKLILEKTGIACIQLMDCEADDLITSFIKQSKKIYSNLVFDIFTRDKDLLQLLDENTNVLKYIKGKITLYTVENFYQEYNFSPSNFADYLSLLGDNIDNIKGVKGIGPVGAKNLIQQFHTVENIYQQKNNLPENNIRLLEDNQELVYRNKKIIGLEENISLPANLYEKCDFSWEKWKKNSELKKFCVENSFKSVLKLLD